MGKERDEERHRRRKNLEFNEQFEREFLYQLHRLQQRDKTIEEYRQKIRQKMELLCWGQE